MTTELIPPKREIVEDDRRFAVCYARGSVFRKEGNFLKIEKGSRTVVNRALCLVQHFGKRCAICPNSDIKVALEVQSGLPKDEHQ